MSTPAPRSLAHLTDSELLAGLVRIVIRGNQLMAELLEHIGEVDARRLYLPAGCSSMFTYCVRVLGLSEDAAYRRIQAARAARRYPLILDLVARGKLHLAGVTLLAPHLSPENHRELLMAAMCLSKRDVERLIAQRFPSPDPPSFVRRCPCSVSSIELGAAPLAFHGGAAAPLAASPQSAEPGTAAAGLAPGQVGVDGMAQPAPGQVGGEGQKGDQGPIGPYPCPHAITPLGPARYQVQFTAGAPLHDKLRTAQALLGSSAPHGDLAQVFERALDALLRDLRRRKFGHTERAKDGRGRSSPASTQSRRIPARIRREVAARDGEQCTFVDPETGRRCDARSNLQFHHLEPWARRRAHDPATLTLRCAAHNLYAARQDYGAQFVAHKIAAAGQRGDLVPPSQACPPGSRDPPAGVGAAT